MAKNLSQNIFLSTGRTDAFYVHPSLESRLAGTCDLFFLLNIHGSQLCLRERRSGRILAVEMITTAPDRQGWKQSLTHTSTSSRILKQLEFSRVTVAVSSPEYTLVPEGLYHPGDEEAFFRKNFRRQSQILTARHVPSHNLYTVFSIDSEIHKDLNHYFQDPKILHHSQALLAGTTLRKSEPGKALLLHVQPRMVDLLVTENKGLVLLNSFSWQAKEDVLYYTLYICEQLGLDPDKVSVTTSGEASPDSELFKLLRNYIRNIAAIKSPSSGQQMPPEQDFKFFNYSTLYNLSFCE